MGRFASLGVVITLGLLGAACTSSSAHPASGATTSGTDRSPSALASEGLVVPDTYQEACANFNLTCVSGTTGQIPDVLKRPLRFPVVQPGQSCPATPGHPVNTSFFDGIALGTGLVRPLIAMKGDLLQGTTDASSQQAPGWLAFKTLWFSVPAYQGPFVIRAERLDGAGQIQFDTSTLAPLLVPPGPTVNSSAGYRTIPGQTWVKAPGCYAWQVDGLTFSDVIVVRVVPL
jgi:hypothetical protein